MGAINLELFGHLHNVVDHPGALFDAVVEQHGAIILGTAGRRRAVVRDMNRRTFLTTLIVTPAVAALLAACGDDSAGTCRHDARSPPTRAPRRRVVAVASPTRRQPPMRYCASATRAGS